MLLSEADPGYETVHGIFLYRLLSYIIHLLRIRDGEIAPAQAAHEVNYRRAILGRVETGADLVHQNAAIVRRAVGEIPVDHADRLEAAQTISQFHGGERAEPAQVHVADFLPLLAHAAHRRARRSRHRAEADQDHLRVFGHEFIEVVRRGVAIAEDVVEFFIGFLDHAPRPLRGF